MSLAWAKDTKDLWSQYDKFGFAYIPPKPQNLDEGIYYVTVQVEGDITKGRNLETVKVTKKFRLGFYMESYMASLDGMGIRPILRLYEGNEIKLVPDQFEQPFEIRRTKSGFINELRDFVKDGKSELEVVFSPVMLLLRRRTDSERQISLRNEEWDIIQNVAEANAVKLALDPYRGLLVEIVEKEAGLWVDVTPEGDRRPIDEMQNDGSWMNKGMELVKVSEKDHLNLLRWLESLQGVREK